MKSSKKIVSNAFRSAKQTTFYSLKSNGKVDFYSNDFIRFLENNGFRTVKVGDNVELVRVKDCIVTKVSTSDIKQFVKKHVEGQTEIHKYIIDRTGLFSLNYLDALDCVNLKMHRDTPTSSFHYYQNGVVEVTKDRIKPPIPYTEFKRLVWEDHIIQRDFSVHTDNASKLPVFVDFINKLTNGEQSRLARLCSIIGYCLYDYRTTANTRAIIINDEVVSDQPEGGSGKSLLVTALGKVRKTLNLDGKKFDPIHDFAWQNVDESIRLVHIDDALRGFSFENLFSAISGGITINRKNKDQYALSVKDSPIIIITTNSIIKGISGSYTRRQYSVDIHQHFSSRHTPLDHYKHVFFDEWDSREWAKFDLFMMQCVQMYLKQGVPKCDEVDSQKKDAIRATCISFVDWFDEVKGDFSTESGTATNTAKENYLHSSGQNGLRLSDKKFIGWVSEYCRIYGYQFIRLENQRPRGFRIVLT